MISTTLVWHIGIALAMHTLASLCTLSSIFLVLAWLALANQTTAPYVVKDASLKKYWSYRKFDLNIFSNSWISFLRLIPHCITLISDISIRQMKRWINTLIHIRTFVEVSKIFHSKFSAQRWTWSYLGYWQL